MDGRTRNERAEAQAIFGQAFESGVLQPSPDFLRVRRDHLLAR